MDNLVELVARVHQRLCPSEPPDEHAWVDAYRKMYQKKDSSDPDSLDPKNLKVNLISNKLPPVPPALLKDPTRRASVEQGLIPFNDPSSMSSRGESQEEESRRLFYVALTRAKNVLYLTHSKERQFPSFKRATDKPSKFIGEIKPQSLLLKCEK